LEAIGGNVPKELHGIGKAPSMASFYNHKEDVEDEKMKDVG